MLLLEQLNHDEMIYLFVYKLAQLHELPNKVLAMSIDTRFQVLNMICFVHIPNKHD